MGKVIVILKAILTRVIFGTHGFIAIWRVTSIKNDPYYWYLCATLLALCFEGIFTLTIKKNQEWKWFCPSVFFYLASVVPAIWLIEVDKFDRRLAQKIQAEQGLKMLQSNQTKIIPINNNGTLAKNGEELKGFETFGVEIKIPVSFDAETWATVIEQLLMLILIIGRWMLPKGGLTRDQLSQLLLVYIGTAADIIEFFDSFKDEKIAANRVLCLLILSIWSWSLLQFTFVLTATKSRRTRMTADIEAPIQKTTIKNGIIKVKEVCCSIDVWGILINIILQDAPFLIFRMLLITYYKIISYMNIFFTCKNTLVIILQFYRLFVVQIEKKKEMAKLNNKASATSNLAKAIERAALFGKPPSMGQQQPNKAPRSSRDSRSQHQTKRSGSAGLSSRDKQGNKKHRSQDSIASSGRTGRSSEGPRREFKAAAKKLQSRRKSLSTGNLRSGNERAEEIFEEEEQIDEDELEIGVSASVVSGPAGRGTERESEDSDPDDIGVIDDVSLASEQTTRPARKNIRMSENPGIYKISGSSAASSDRVQYRQDTGYSSSSKDSGSSRRGRNVHQQGRSGRQPSRSRSSQQRRRLESSSRNYSDSSFMGEFEDLEGRSLPPYDAENERI